MTAPLMSAEQKFADPDTVTINPALAETGRRIAELMRRTGGVCSRCAEGVAWDVTPGCAAAGCPVQVVAREIAGEPQP